MDVRVRESIPRQVDKKSGVPKEAKGVCGSPGGDRGLEFSRRRKGQTFFPFTFLSLSHIKQFFSLSLELMITQQTTQFKLCTAAAAKSLQSCPTLCDPIDGSPSGSPIPGILQARALEWIAISFSNA